MKDIDCFVACVHAGREDTLIYCDSNGGVSMTTGAEKVSFEVAKYGAGGDGSLTISVSDKVALPLLASLRELTLEAGKSQ